MRPILAGITLVGPPTVASLSKKETYNQEKETYGLVSYGLMMILFTPFLRQCSFAMAIKRDLIISERNLVIM